MKTPPAKNNGSQNDQCHPLFWVTKLPATGPSSAPMEISIASKTAIGAPKISVFGSQTSWIIPAPMAVERLIARFVEILE